MTLKGPNMKLDAVDESDRIIGRVRRGQALSAGANFRTVHVFVFDRARRLLLQKLSDAKDRHPRRWGSSVATYLRAGEDYADGARRGLQEELGIRDVTPAFVAKVRIQDESSLKFVGLFEVAWDKTIRPDPAEIADVEYTSLDEVLDQTRTAPDRFTPTFTHLLEAYITRAGLPKDHG
jgi:isopentenyldiphosphate isomerase